MRKIILALLLFALPGAAYASETASFLKLGVGARAVGMAGAYTAIADDVNALAWNPAGLSALEKRELGAMHAEMTEQTRYGFAGYAQPSKYGTFAVGGVYLDHGNIDGRDANGRPTGYYSASDQAVSLGFGSRLETGLRLGANVKYIRGSIAGTSAQSCAFDFGGQYALAELGPGVPLLGLAVQNLGPGLKFQDRTSQLPLTVAVGVGYRMPKGLTMAMDFKQRPHAKQSEFSAGAEYALLTHFALRAGYTTTQAESGSSMGDFSALNGFATGLGFKMKGYRLDYSFTPMGELGNVQRFSLAAKF
jgi:long-subunit fatty acid transport protein